MGYFRILYYISYIFNTIVRIFRRNKKFLFILIVITLIFIILNNESQAAYEGDFTYSDPNATFESTYDDVCIRFLRRFELVNSDNKQQIIDLVKNRNFKLYIYFGSSQGVDGSSMMNAYNFDDSFYYIAFIPSDQRTWNRTLSSNVYMTIDNIACSNFEYLQNDLPSNFQWKIYRVSTSSIDLMNISYGFTLTMPSNCYGMINKYVYEYFFNNYSIEQIETLQDINNNLDNVNNNLETITDDTVSQDTTDSTNDVLEDSQSVFDNSFTNDLTSYNNSFLQTILAPINQLADGTTTKRVSFTLPYVNYTYTLRGDAISSHIRDTAIYTYVQLFWWFAFSVPIFTLLRRILLWLGTGEFINKPSKFALYMSNFVSNNITPGMM